MTDKTNFLPNLQLQRSEQRVYNFLLKIGFDPAKI